MQLFQELNDEGVSVILVTHEPHIARHARRLVQLRDGQIVSDQPVRHRLLARDWLADPENNSTELLEL